MAGAGLLYGGFVGDRSLQLLVVLTVAGIGTAVLLGLAIGAFVRRQSRPYLLILAAVAALFGRSAVAGLTVTGTFSPTNHHLLEHGLDVVLVALVIAAVYHARTVSRDTDVDT